MHKNSKRQCVECGSDNYYARGWCHKCYDKNTRKRGQCTTCGKQTCRPTYQQCKTCSNRDNPKHTKPHTAETRAKMRLSSWRARNEKHPGWKGDAAGYDAIHKWIRSHKTIPLGCEMCGKVTNLHASNKDHKYSRNLDDWQFLCVQCHKTYDLKNGLYSNAGTAHPLYGKQHSDETKKKISNTLKRKGITPQLYKQASYLNN